MGTKRDLSRQEYHATRGSIIPEFRLENRAYICIIKTRGHGWKTTGTQ